MNKIKFDVWGGLELKRNLDGAMTNRLKEFGIFPVSENNCPIINYDGKLLRVGHVGYKLNEMNGFAIDIKTKTNVTSFDRYLARNSNSIEYLDGEFLASKLNENTIAEIIALGNEE